MALRAMLGAVLGAVMMVDRGRVLGLYLGLLFLFYIIVYWRRRCVLFSFTLHEFDFFKNS